MGRTLRALCFYNDLKAQTSAASGCENDAEVI